MEFHIVRLGEVAELSEKHPVVADSHPELAESILPPMETDDPDFPILFYAEERGKMACMLRSFPDAMVLGDNTIPFAWNGNLMTLPAFRRRGLAQAIVERQLEEFERQSIVWAGVFSSVPALRLYEKMSFTMMGMSPRMCLVRRVTPFLREHTPEIAAKILGGIGTAGMKTLDAVLRYRQPYRGQVRLQDISAEAFAALPEAQFRSQSHEAYWDTNANWILRRRAVRDIDQLCLAYLEGDHDPVGYLVIRQRENIERPIREKYYGVNVMTVMHYGVFGQNLAALEILLAAALNRFWQSDADMFEIVTSCPDLQQAAHRAGMISLGAGMSFKFREPSPFHGKLPRSLSAYKMTHYAGDAFAFE